MLKNLSILFALLLIGNCCMASRLPGTSIADDLLQHDSMLTVFSSAYLAAGKKNCRTFSITDTQVIKIPNLDNLTISGKNHGVGPWTELWTVNVCNTNVYVPINFIPDDRGTAFVVNQKDIKVKK